MRCSATTAPAFFLLLPKHTPTWSGPTDLEMTIATSSRLLLVLFVLLTFELDSGPWIMSKDDQSAADCTLIWGAYRASQKPESEFSIGKWPVSELIAREEEYSPTVVCRCGGQEHPAGEQCLPLCSHVPLSSSPPLILLESLCTPSAVCLQLRRFSVACCNSFWCIVARCFVASACFLMPQLWCFVASCYIQRLIT